MPRKLSSVIGMLSIVGMLSGCAGTAAPKSSGTNTSATGAARKAGKATVRGINTSATSVTNTGKSALTPKGRSTAATLTNQAKGTASRTKRSTGNLLSGTFGSGPTTKAPSKTAAPGGSTVPNPAPLGTSKPTPSANKLVKEILVFYDPADKVGPNGLTQSLAQLGKDTSVVNALVPLWYDVQPDGSLKSHVDSPTMAFAKAHNLKLEPLIRNGNGNQAFLMDTTTRDTAVRNITNLVNTNKYPGVNIDFELLTPPARIPLEQFMDELSHNLRPYGKEVTVDIIPTAAQTGAHGAYDEIKLAQYSDAIVLMAYDHHSDASPPGPVSPHDWVLASVKHTLQSGVPASKIILGVNNYGYDWDTVTQTATTIPEKQAATIQSTTRTFNTTYEEYYLTYTDSKGHLHQVWYGGPRTLADRLNIARTYNLRGLAIWRAGYENVNYWKHLTALNTKTTKPAPMPQTKMQTKMQTNKSSTSSMLKRSTKKSAVMKPAPKKSSMMGKGAKSNMQKGAGQSKKKA